MHIKMEKSPYDGADVSSTLFFHKNGIEIIFRNPLSLDQGTAEQVITITSNSEAESSRRKSGFNPGHRQPLTTSEYRVLTGEFQCIKFTTLAASFSIFFCQP